MSPKGRPEGKRRSAQREGSSGPPKGRPEGERRSAQRVGPGATARRLRVRPYVGAELEAVVRCFQRSVHVIGARYYGPEQVAAWAPEPPDLAAWARRLATGGVLVADADAAVAGFVRVEESGWIDLLYVHPEHQRRGIGRSLLAHACSWAAARGARRWATDASLAARPLFESLGFRVETEQWVERHGVSFRNFRMARDAGQPMEAGP